MNETQIYANKIFVGKLHGRVILGWFVHILVASKLDTAGPELADWEADGMTVKKLLW